MSTVLGDDVKDRKTKARRARKDAEPESRGLNASQLASGTPPPQITDLRRAIEQDGGWVLGTYRDPIGEHWQILAGLPLAKIAPTPFQRELCEGQVDRLAHVIDAMNRFVAPIVAVRNEAGVYWTPDGHHRVAAMRKLGARSIVALVAPEAEMAYPILALNSARPRTLRERSLEAIRLARSLAESDPRPEREFALELEDPELLTLGLCYEQRPGFDGCAYRGVLERLDGFLATGLPKALPTRQERAAKLLELDDAVEAILAALRARGLEGPTLRQFVMGRLDPLRVAKEGGSKEAKPTFDEALEKMIVRARRFDAEKVTADQLAAASGLLEE
jgi:ParB family chromosome partitioning protein